MFFFHSPSTTWIYTYCHTLSLHDALPIVFDLGILKSSGSSDEFRARYLARPGHEGVFEGRAIVFDGSDDYHYRINDPALAIDEDCIRSEENTSELQSLMRIS